MAFFLQQVMQSQNCTYIYSIFILNLKIGFKKYDGMSGNLAAKLQRNQDLLNSILTRKNFGERFFLLLACEEFQMRIDIRSFDMTVRYETNFY